MSNYYAVHMKLIYYWMSTIIEKFQKLKEKFKKMIFKIELCTYEQLKKIKINTYRDMNS